MIWDLMIAIVDEKTGRINYMDFRTYRIIHVRLSASNRLEVRRMQILKKNSSITQNAKKAAILSALKVNLKILAAASVSEVLAKLHSNINGLSEEAIAESLREHGSNEVTREKKPSLFKQLVNAFVNPFTAILLFWPWFLS